jgi:hypothetical protein
MLIPETRTAKAAKNYGTLCGTNPPPRRSRPPTAVIPEIAFVIDMSGV